MFDLIKYFLKIKKHSVFLAEARIQDSFSMKNYAVYILASGKNGTLYIGITGDLEHRVWEHKQEKIKGFTKKYKVNKLVYYELYSTPQEAITREKNLKKWNRIWKLRIIEEKNPYWKDLYNIEFGENILN